MRLATLTLVALLSLGAPVPAPAATTTRTGDWVLIVADGGSTGTPEGFASTCGKEVLTGRGPWVHGMGASWSPFGIRVYSELSGGPVDLRTSQGAHAAHLDVAETAVPGEYQACVGASVDPLAPHERSYALFLTGNARWTFSRFNVGKGLHVQFLVRSGTQVLRFVDSADGGVGAAAGPVAAGLGLTRQQTVRTGIAGGIAAAPRYDADLPASGSWTGPYGRHGSWKTAPGSPAPDSPFAGPSGRWSWSWSGAAQGGGQPPAMAVYAPVGAVWRLFEPRPRT